jgi:hypothetical protein
MTNTIINGNFGSDGLSTKSVMEGDEASVPRYLRRLKFADPIRFYQDHFINGSSVYRCVS